MAGVTLVLLSACRTLVVDPSIQAVEAGDFTLLNSACEALPGRGMDICRVKEFQIMTSAWRLVLPVDKAFFLGGEVTVYFKDTSRSFAITQPLVEIPWREIFYHQLPDPLPTWKRSMDGEVLALAQIRMKTNHGLEEIWKARGIAKIVVTRSGYDPLPIDSGYEAWKGTCEVSYSTAGRSALRCE